MAIAITASPTLSGVVVSGPISSTTPAASIPGTWGVGTFLSISARLPSRIPVSVGLTVAACTRIRISPGPAWTSGSSMTCNTSGPPNSVSPTPRMIPSLPANPPRKLIVNGSWLRLVRSDNLAGPKVDDSFPVVAELKQILLGVLPQLGRPALRHGQLASEHQRRAGHGG